jgi:hypothetical protein
MKKRRLTYFLQKKFYYLPLVLLGAVSVGPGCQKSKHDNPCEGVVSEGTPTQVGLVLIDGQTGENILLARNIDASTITITSDATGTASETGVIIKQSGAPMYGALVFSIADTKKGTFKYSINIPAVDSTTLSYINKEEKTNNECNPYHINVTDPVIEDHQFTVSRTGHRLLFKVTL